jgi:hypothetical protein
MTDILERLGNADPWPFSTGLPEGLETGSALLAAIHERSRAVKTIDKTSVEHPKSRRVLVAAATALAVVVVVGVAALLRPAETPAGSGGPVAGSATAPDHTLPEVAPVPLTDPEPLAVARAYLDRIGAGDLRGALALHSPEFRTRTWTGVIAPGGPAEQAARWAQYHIMVGGTIEHRCEADSEPDTVTCQVRIADEFTRRLGVEEPEYTWTILVNSGFIEAGDLFPTLTGSGVGMDPNTPYGQMIGRYDAWARDNHLNAFVAACRTGGSGTLFPNWNTACADFQLVHLEEFTESIGG